MSMSFQIEDGELQCALPQQPSCEYATSFDALRLTGWDAANGARAWQKPSHWRLNPCDFKDPTVRDRHVHGERKDWTCAATWRHARLNHLSQCLRHWLPTTDNQAGADDKPFSLHQSLCCTSQDMRSENHCTSPSLLCTTHQSESVWQPGQSTTSIETPKVKNPDPMLHLIRPTHSMMYVPLQVDIFQKSILLILQNKYWKSCSGDFILQNPILCTRSCGTGLITQSSWVFHFQKTTLIWWKCFVPQLYQFRRGISGGPALKYFYMFHRDGRTTPSDPLTCLFPG